LQRRKRLSIDELISQQIAMTKHYILFFSLFLIVSNAQAKSNPAEFRFERFGYNEKLPSNSVVRIFHDKEGFMWFGTKDGLCRFDGYDMKTFRSSASTPGKLTNNEIQCITEDNDQQLWVGTFEGINIIDKKSYSIRALDNIYVKSERINSILTDSKGYVWIGTSNYGALRMDPRTGSYKRFSSDKNSPLKLRGNNVTNIYEDHSGRIWISLWKNGLCNVDKSLNHITYIPKIGNNNNPFRIYQERNGLFWICTWGDGIFNMTANSNKEINLHPLVVSKDSEKKVDNIVYSIAQDDKNGYIWVVTFSGLNLIKKETNGSYKVTETKSFFDASASNVFHEITKDRRGNLWLGSDGEGLFNLDFNKLSVQNISLSGIKNTLNIQPCVTNFCKMITGELYIVINRIGLFRFNPKTGEAKRPTDTIVRGLKSIHATINISSTNEMWVADEGEDMIHVLKNNAENNLVEVNHFSLGNSKAFKEISITTFFEDSKKNIWIGTSRGLYMKAPKLAVRLISSKISNVNTIGEDTNNKIWVGTEKAGLFVCKPEIHGKKSSYTFSQIRLKINSYQSNSVQSICCSKNGEVYIGTKEGCLYLYNQKTHTANDISGLYSITDVGIMDILEDNEGMLWISTIKKIIRYNPRTHAATYYSSADGMLVSSFFKDACVKLNSGQILFGGNMGISAFNPGAQKNSPKPLKQHVIITDILIQNKSIFEDEMNTHFNYEKNRVRTKYYENNISIEFPALDFSAASKIQYAYKLSGIDKNWYYLGNNRRFVNYANLPEGDYTFLVKASDENGVWSDQITTLKVVVLPPPYRTWWAYLLYLIVLGTIVTVFVRTLAHRIQLRNELKISQIEKNKSEELAQIKLRYFTNISHELLTPLTIIMLLIENLQKKNSADSTQFEMMKANVIRLKRLIQQILVFRKTESGNMKLKIHQNDIVAFVNNICQSNFQPLINEKEITFSVKTEHESYMAYFDPDKLDKILYNLLSNAFKHTHNGGSITVQMSFIPRNEEMIMRLSVSDSGEGISEEDLPHIFKRFYISKSSDQSKSHGIGLALTSDLLQIHKGSIEVKSELGEGTIFTIEIPVSVGAYTKEELTEEEEVQPIELAEKSDITDIIVSEVIPENEIDIEIQKNFTILVVEDNKELKNLIVENFANRYQVLSAENGFQALDIIQKNEIDLVISDVMMPEMDGLTLCKIIKNDIETSQINVLMLTAKNTTEDRIECYNAGADSFISKPFELAVLEARTKNLISKRKQKVENFRKNQEINISSMEYGSIDEQFLKQAVKKVEEKLSDETFDFDQFALDMATSKSTLHRKLKSLTGLSPVEFIRNIRLKHAIQMLTTNMGNISEIAFAVGFNDPKYFSRCFKIEFGLTPREFQDSKKS